MAASSAGVEKALSTIMKPFDVPESKRRPLFKHVANRHCSRRKTLKSLTYGDIYLRLRYFNQSLPAFDMLYMNIVQTQTRARQESFIQIFLIIFSLAF